MFFEINLNEKDIILLEQIKNFFNIGWIHWSQRTKSIQFQVRAIKYLSQILDHFDKYGLITEECSDFKLFKQTFKLKMRKEHLILEGLLKIVGIKT